MSILNVNGLSKAYPSFKLKDVSFSLEPGKITGFIGRNGAGKSTTLNSLLNFVHPDSGDIRFFGLPFSEHELEIKQRIGFVSSGINYYSKKKLKKITAVTRCFYNNWDDAAYRKYLSLFALDENKTPSELSAGMKVKYALALAMSHNAELLILDEPTSGLDPVSRDELLDNFMTLCDEGKTILFSTHITSDLDNCADSIIYIKEGRIIAEKPIKDFVGGYREIEFTEGQLSPELEALTIGKRRIRDGFTALINASDTAKFNVQYKDADLESCMVHLDKEADL